MSSDRWLVLDVDGVLLDPDRAGDGHWTNELCRRFGIDRARLRDTFFQPSWEEIVTGRRPIEPALTTALAQLGTDVGAEAVLACWFEADFVPHEAALATVRRAIADGVRVALATNQEHRRAMYLRPRFASIVGDVELVASADVGCRKPQPEFYAAVEHRLGIMPDGRETLVFVDDDERNVMAAAAAGWRAVHAVDDGWITEVAEVLAL